MRSPLGALADAVRNQAPPYVGRSTPTTRMWPLRSDTEAQMRAIESVGTLFAIVGQLASAVSQVNWRLYRTAKSGLPEDREEVTSHAALDLWNRPNRFMIRQELVENTEQHVDLTGEGWLMIGRNGRSRIPLELWPLRPDRVLPIPHREKFLAGYEYLAPDGERVPLKVDEVIQLRLPNPLDPYRGLGPVQALLTDLESSKFAALWNRNFFLNSAQPGGIIEYDRRLSDDEFDELRDRWQEQHQGVAQAHRVAILEGGKYVERTYSMRDMEFSELRGVSREIIREAFAYPKPMLGTVDDANRANMEAAEITFSRWLVVSRLERFKGALNADLLPLFGSTAKGLEFDYDNPVPDDRAADNAERTSKASAASMLVTAGWAPDDVLDAVGLPEMEFIGTAPAVEQLPPPPPDPAALPPGGDGPEGEPEEDPAELEPLRAHGLPRPRVLPAVPVRDATDPDDDEELPDIGPLQVSWAAALAALLARWINVLTGWVNWLIDKIRDLIRRGDRRGLGDLDTPPHDDATDDVADTMQRLAHDAAGQVQAEAGEQGVQIDIGEADAAELRVTAESVVRQLAEEARQAAEREASRLTPPGAEGDAEADRIAELVRERLEQLGDEEARRWLGHALTQAQHAGRTATMRRAETGLSGATVAYYGREKNDGRTCDLCREIDGRWLGNRLGDALRDYPAGGYSRCRGGIRCRGMVVAVYRPGPTRTTTTEEGEGE